MDSKAQLAQKIGEMETSIARMESELQQYDAKIQSAGTQKTIAAVAFFVGLLLTPLGVGIFILIIALLAYFTQGGKIKQAQNDRQATADRIAGRRGELAAARAQLYGG